MAHALRREDLTFAERALVRIVQRVDVAAPPEAVWPAIAETEAWPQWFAGMTAARATTDAPFGVGSQRWVSVQGLEATEEILAFDEARRFAFTVLELNRPGLRAMVEVLTLEPTSQGTHVTYCQAVEVAGWARPLLPVLRRQMHKGLGQGLAGLPRWVADRVG